MNPNTVWKKHNKEVARKRKQEKLNNQIKFDLIMILKKIRIEQGLK